MDKLLDKWRNLEQHQKSIIIGVTVFIAFFTYHNFDKIISGNIFKEPEPATDLTYEHKDDASTAAFHFLLRHLNKDSDIEDNTLRIAKEDVLPTGKHIYEVTMSGNYVLKDFEDDYGRDRVKDTWEVKVEYIGEEDGEWRITKNEDNWKVIDIRYGSF